MNKISNELSFIAEEYENILLSQELEEVAEQLENIENAEQLQQIAGQLENIDASYADFVKAVQKPTRQNVMKYEKSIAPKKTK